MNYYKAVRPNGRDFYTNTIDYAKALETGELVRHPTSTKKIANEADTYLSISTEPADCTGFQWPCRLFRVEPVGRAMSNLTASPHKRAVLALRVIEELPSWMALGPNGEAVAKHIKRCRALTKGEADRLYAARGAARDAAWDAAWDAARDAAWNAARDAAWNAAWDAAWNAARDAALALLVRDLITPEQFDLLTKPWRDAGLELPE